MTDSYPWEQLVTVTLDIKHRSQPFTSEETWSQPCKVSKESEVSRDKSSHQFWHLLLLITGGEKNTLVLHKIQIPLYRYIGPLQYRHIKDSKHQKWAVAAQQTFSNVQFSTFQQNCTWLFGSSSVCTGHLTFHTQSAHWIQTLTCVAPQAPSETCQQDVAEALRRTYVCVCVCIDFNCCSNSNNTTTQTRSVRTALTRTKLTLNIPTSHADKSLNYHLN